MVSWLRSSWAPALVAGIAFLAARTAMLPGLAFWDTAELQAVGPLMGTAHPAGFPTYALLGWLASVVLQPFGEPAFRMNLFAGLCLAFAAGLTVDLVRALTRSTLAGVLAGIGLALTPAAWALGTHAEAHALHLAFVVVLLRLLVAWEARARTGGSRPSSAPGADRFLVAAAIVFGLSVGNHSLTLLLALPVALFVLAVDRSIWRDRRLVSLCLGAFAAAVILVYLELPLRAGPFRAALVYGRPETWDGFWYVALSEQFRTSLVDPFGDLPAKFASLVARAVDQFGPLTPLVPPALAITFVRQPRYALLTFSTVAITCLFAASYLNADIGRYYVVPVLLVWTWLAILVATVAAWTGRLSRRVVEHTATQIGDPSRSRAWRVLAVVPTLGLVVAMLAPTGVSLGDRFDAVDESRDRRAAGWVDHALSVMEPGAVLVSWWSYSTPLWYAQRVEGRRPDLAIVDDRTRLDEELGDIIDVIDANLGTRPVYVIRDDPDEIELLAVRYELEFIDGRDARALTRVLRLREAGG